MTSSKRIMLAAAAMALSAVCAGAAVAGGQMGGGDMSSSGPPPPKYDAAKEYQTGLDAMKAEKWALAARAFSHVTVVEPKDGDAWTKLGQAKAAGGDAKAAVKAFERAVKIDPDNLLAQRELGVNAAKSGQTPKAQAALDAIKAKAAACGTCSKAGDLKEAQGAIEAAMGAGMAPAATGM